MIYKVLCGTFATKIIYIQCCTEDADSPAVTWAWTCTWTWTWCSCGTTPIEFDIIWIGKGCQTVIL